MIDKQEGTTFAELAVSIFIFSFFLLAVYTTLDVGLKSWQLGETKSDLQQKAEVVLNRVIRDLRDTNLITAQIDDAPVDGYHQYICVETPINPATGLFIPDKHNVGIPYWQGYVLYYIYPQSPVGGKRDFYRRFIPRTTSDPNTNIPISSFPTRLTGNILTYIDNNLQRANVTTGIVAKDLYSIDFERDGSKISVTVCLKKYIRQEKHVSFAPDADPNTGKEIIELKASVNPKNQ